MIAVNIFFLWRKTERYIFTYHLEGLRVPPMVPIPQFGNHCIIDLEKYGVELFYSFRAHVLWSARYCR